MKLVPLVCAAGVVLVSGGCAERITAPSSAPAIVRIRSVTTNYSLRTPLFVLDGHILNGDAEVRQIDPAWIENIEVLKGVAAVERFGSAGVNGVVLITTKRGS